MLERILKIGLLLCLAASVSLAQKDKDKAPKPLPKAKPEPAEKIKPPAYPEPPHYQYDERKTSEKAIAVDPNVAIKLCISEGAVKVNGWERNEVRVFVHNGRKFEIKSLEKNPSTGKANWLWLTNVRPVGAPAGPNSDCLGGESIELDVPFGTGIDLFAREADVMVDSVKKANIKVDGGKINLRNVAGGVTALTLRGDVTIESSSGEISLETTTGNVVAYDVAPGQVGDLLRVKTKGGSISLQNVNHRQIDADSYSGSVAFAGKLLSGGIYRFKSSNGSVRLLLPADTSCKVVASYGFGTFETILPVKMLTQTTTPGGMGFVGTIGKGDTTTVNITTTKGSVEIRPRN